MGVSARQWVQVDEAKIKGYIENQEWEEDGEALKIVASAKP